MQTDFMAMAQGQQQGEQISFEQAKTAITEMLDEMGLQSGANKAQIVKEIDVLAQLVANNDEQGMQNNKLFQLIMGVIEQLAQQQGQMGGTGGPVPQQGQAEAAPTKDFASMMPPTPGGGLPGL
jgi:hypothetical protein